MKRYFRQHLVLALALAALVPSLSFAQNKLVVAIQPTVASDEMLNKAKPLQQFHGKRVWAAEPKSRSTCQAVTPPWWSRFAFGHAHIAFMSAWPAQLAVRLGGAEVALAEIRQVLHGKDKVEAPHYFSYWVVAPDSPYKDLPSLKGKSACFPSPISTSGFVAPMGRMIEMNLIAAGRRQRSRSQSLF